MAETLEARVTEIESVRFVFSQGMKNKYVKFLVLMTAFTVILGVIIYIILLIQFGRQSTWEPPDDYEEVRQPLEQDSISNSELTDSVNLKTLHEYLKREQYGSAPLKNGKYWKKKMRNKKAARFL